MAEQEKKEKKSLLKKIGGKGMLVIGFIAVFLIIGIIGRILGVN